jgi:hypothetical protein
MFHPVADPGRDEAIPVRVKPLVTICAEAAFWKDNGPSMGQEDKPDQAADNQKHRGENDQFLQ